MSAIAVVGMACRYPDAASPEELWENVLAQRRAFRRWPEERLRAADYLSSDASDPDRTYCAQAAVIEGYEFDRARFRVVGSTYRAVDPVHWLALDIATQALVAAGFGDDAQGLPRETTGVIVGNSLTGEFSRANLLRLRWPYVRRTLEAELAEVDWSAERRAEFLDALEERYKAPFPEVGEETLAGGLSNTIAGRICNHFDLKGGGFTVDAACASSLLAIAQSCSALVAGDLDVALAGGVDLSLDPFEVIGFSRLGALARSDMRVYDERSAGFWPGEGCGFVVLMREADARAQGRTILATVRGWGVSSDGHGGITRPEVEGQLLAVRRAYRRAGFGPERVVYVEGHGTGTEVGDRTELTVLRSALAEAGATLPVVVGSVKANIGHTKAAAGVAGFVKAVQALRHGIVPPNTGCHTPHRELESGRLEIRRTAEPWPSARPLLAASSSMGFGGINVHVVVEGEERARRDTLTDRERKLLRTPQDSELLLFSADSPAELRSAIEPVLQAMPRLSRADLTDLAVHLSKSVDPADAGRAAIVAATAEEATARLTQLADRLDRGETRWLADGVFLGVGPPAARLGFLFPGQGSPAHAGGGMHARRFERFRALLERTALPTDGDGVDTRIAQPAIATASAAALRVLTALGIRADVVLGHSLGELSALHCAGVFGEGDLIDIATARGAAMGDLAGEHGAMAGVQASAGEVTELLAGTSLVIAGLNAPRRTVVAGRGDEIDAFVAAANARGWRGARIAVSHAFHSPLVADAAPALAEHLAGVALHAPRTDVASTITGALLAPRDDIRELLVRQVTHPVRFTEAVDAAGDVDAWLEVGPGSVLTGLLMQPAGAPAFPLDAGSESLVPFLGAVGAAWALGRVAHPEALFRDRFSRPFDPRRPRKFFANPCEEAPAFDAPADSTRRARRVPAAASVHDPADSLPDLVRKLVAERVELPVELVEDGHRMLSDLHLNSIAVAQLVNDAARLAGKSLPASPTDYANASVAEIAEALQQRDTAQSKRERMPSGVASWIRSFTVESVERAASPPDTFAPGAWQVDGPAAHPLAGLPAAFRAGVPGAGTVVCLPRDPGEADLARLVRAGQAAFVSREGDAKFVVVQDQGGGGAFARTLQREAPWLTVRLVDVPFDHPDAVRWIVAEAAATGAYREVRYDARGRRLEPELRVLPDAPGPAPLGPQDVLLVTGGGKGITAECALDLARAYGPKVALLGRSHPENDAALAANLARFVAGSIRFVYLPTDVTDPGAVRAAVARVEEELGPVTAILHGAGRNDPRLLPEVSADTLRAALSPKVDGLDHVLAVVDPARLRLLVAFGSIISRLGLPGETDYAIANEYLTRRVRRHHLAHPKCRCAVVDWSVWSGIGMGERIGHLESLVAAGVTPIPPEAGIRLLRGLLERDLPTLDVIVSGRFGQPATAPPAAPLPFARFLETVRVHTPGVELVAEATISLRTDPYLNDHVFRGDPVFPAVMILEAMAQVYGALTGEPGAPAFDRLELRAPIVVRGDEPLVLRCASLRRPDGSVDLVLRCSTTDFQVDHCLATAHALSAVSGEVDAKTIQPANGVPVTLDPARHLYGKLLFHGGRFRRLARYLELRAERCVAEISPNGKTGWFDRTLPGELALGDPSVRDAALHAIQACIPQATILPVGADRVEIFAERPAGPNGSGDVDTRFVRARERSREGKTFTYDLEIVDGQGRCRERWTGLRLAVVVEGAGAPWIPALLGPYVERRLGELDPGARLGVALSDGAADARPARRGHAVAQLLGPAAEVAHAPNGRPEIVHDPAAGISVAHEGRLTMAVTGPGAVGCDLARVDSRSPREWSELLGGERMDLARRIEGAGESAALAATRVWSAAECLRKAGAAGDEPLTLGPRTDDGWTLLHSGSLVTATVPLRMDGNDDPFVLAVTWRRSGHA